MVIKCRHCPIVDVHCSLVAPDGQQLFEAFVRQRCKLSSQDQGPRLSQTHRAKQYEVTSFLSTDCELSTCSKNVYSLGPLSAEADDAGIARYHEARIARFGHFCSCVRRTVHVSRFKQTIFTFWLNESVMAACCFDRA